MPPTSRPSLNTSKGGTATNRPQATPKGRPATPKSAGKAATSRGTTSGSAPSEKSEKPTKRTNKKAQALTAGKLLEIVEAQLATAKEFEDRIGTFDSLTSKLGNALGALFEGGMSMKEIFAKMDKNKDGKVTKMEFRQAIRDLGLMGEEYTVIHVDKLFTELDADHSTDLNLDELKEALVLFKQHAKEAKEATIAAETKSVYWRARAEESKIAAEAVAKSEDAKAEVERLKNEPSAESRLAGLLVKKNLKPNDLFSQMDANKNGIVDVGEFGNSLRKLGLDASDEELKRIYTGFDKDGSGDLDLSEVKGTVKSLFDAKVLEAENLKVLTKELGPLEKQAQVAQASILKLLDEDEVAKLAEEEKKAKEEADRWAAKASAKAKAEAAKEKKAAKLEVEKQQFEAKVQERRLTRHDSMPLVLTKQKTRRLSSDLPAPATTAVVADP